MLRSCFELKFAFFLESPIFWQAPPSLITFIFYTFFKSDIKHDFWVMSAVKSILERFCIKSWEKLSIFPKSPRFWVWPAQTSLHPIFPSVAHLNKHFGTPQPFLTRGWNKSYFLGSGSWTKLAC